MPAEFHIVKVTPGIVGSANCWIIHKEAPDGVLHLHVLPVETLDWRAAEYDIDRDDVETLLDIALHEPHMAPADTPLAQATGRTALPSRAAHIQRITEAKSRVRVVSDRRAGIDPLDPIRRHRLPAEDAHQIRKAVAFRRAAPKEDR